MDEPWRDIPTIVLLLDHVRRVSVDEARSVIEAELGAEAASTTDAIGTNSAGMRYLEWRVGATPYHLGTSSGPYIHALGSAKADEQNRLVEPVKWTMREEVPPEGEEFCSAWMAHNAWLYVDALLFRSENQDRHRRNVFRIAAHFVDERCVLVWHCGGEPKRVALPTPRAVAALRAGEWPE